MKTFSIKKNDEDKNKKTSTDNQWISTGLNPSDNRERRDGPGGEDADTQNFNSNHL